MKIGICGSFSTGKTTLATRLSSQIRLRLLPEMIKVLSPNKSPKDMCDITLHSLQRNCINLQNASEQRNSEFVAECCLYNYYAYSAAKNVPIFNMLAGLSLRLAREPDRYDLLVYCPIEFDIVDDGYRHLDKDFQLKIDSLIREVIKDKSVLIVQGNVDERVKQVRLALVK